MRALSVLNWLLLMSCCVCVPLCDCAEFPAAAVVIRSSLVPFVCTTKNGVATLDAEASIVCDVNAPGPYEKMRDIGAACIVFYGMGVPVGFAFFLWRYHKQVRLSGASGVCFFGCMCVCVSRPMRACVFVLRQRPRVSCCDRVLKWMCQSDVRSGLEPGRFEWLSA